MIEYSKTKWLPILQEMWQEAFGDGEEFITSFHQTIYREELTWCWVENDRPVSVIYGIGARVWLNETGASHPVCYLYAGATAISSRGKGYYETLIRYVVKQMEPTAAVILVPARGLENYYEGIGFDRVLSEPDHRYPLWKPIQKAEPDEEQIGPIQSGITLDNQMIPMQIHHIDAIRYGQLRNQLLGRPGYIEWDSVFLTYALQNAVRTKGDALEILRNGQRYLLLYEIVDFILYIVETTLTRDLLYQIAFRLAQEKDCREVLVKGVKLMACGMDIDCKPYFRIALD